MASLSQEHVKLRMDHIQASFLSFSQKNDLLLTFAGSAGKQLIFVQFHTAFESEKMTLSKRDLDGAYNKRSSVFAEDFSLTIDLESGNTKV